jgi:hypothetical protein
MTQKPVLREEVHVRALRASQFTKGIVFRGQDAQYSHPPLKWKVFMIFFETGPEGPELED